MSKFKVITGSKTDEVKDPFPHPSTCPAMIEMNLHVEKPKLVWCAPKKDASNTSPDSPDFE